MTPSQATPPSRHLQGFTLVEMLITVTIMAILTAMAAPSFSRLVANSRMVSTTNDLKNALQNARSEAQRRGDIRGVSLRAIGTTTHDFSTGWRVFTDNGLDGAISAGDLTLVEQRNTIGTTITVHRVLRSGTAGSFTYSDATSLTGRNFVTFNSQGQNNGTAPAFFKICDSSMTNLPGRIIQVSVAGVVTLDSTTETCP